MQVPVRFLKAWQGYEPGDEAQFGGTIADQLLEQGLAERVAEGEPFAPLRMPFSAQQAAGRVLSHEAGPSSSGEDWSE